MHRFISDFNNDLGHPVLRGAHASQQLQQLQSLQEKLKAAVLEISRLQGPDMPMPAMPADASFGTTTVVATSPPTSTTDIALELASAARAAAVRTSDGGKEVLPANAGGGVADTVALLTRQAADENAATINKIKEEQRRLQAQKKVWAA